jgi:exodeoxyribonuclease V alpha subunit
MTRQLKLSPVKRDPIKPDPIKADPIPFDLNFLHDLQLVSHLDYYFARTMAEAFDETDPLVIVSCALASKALGSGHICLDLKKEAGGCLRIPEQEGCIRLPDLELWENSLANASMVGMEDQGESCETGPENRFPLVLDSTGKLYLSRYYDFQKRLVNNLSARMSRTSLKIEEKFIAKHLDPLFSGQNLKQVGQQKEAVKKALAHNFLVISGGPGTGKTYITAMIKSLFCLYAASQKMPEPRILSLAPTGKAASRLGEGRTIHSVLKPLKGKSGFRHTKKNRLNVDMVIVDEASMIDIALMTRLIEAIPPEAKVILLGDKNQLSPVQAGGVFNDICRVKSLSSHLIFLEYNFRSMGKTGIENLARAINRNDPERMEAILSSDQYPDIRFENTRREDTQRKKHLYKIIEKYIKNGYAPLAEQTSLLKGLDNLDRFRILCAHNRGSSGTLQINHLCEKILRSQFNFDITGKFFKKIVMIRVNDYHKGLFNGDTGVVHVEDKGFTAGFKDVDGNIRQYRYSDLPAHETAFAVTIHKSQGSEFDSVLIIIPEKLSPVVTRQLLYTGITRARKKAIIVGSLEVIKEAMTLSFEPGSNLSFLLEQRLCQNR